MACLAIARKVPRLSRGQVIDATDVRCIVCHSYPPLFFWPRKLFRRLRCRRDAPNGREPQRSRPRRPCIGRAGLLSRHPAIVRRAHLGVLKSSTPSRHNRGKPSTVTGFRLRGSKSGMRNGYSDPQIAANPQTASHNIGLFVYLNELPLSPMTQNAWSAALGIADDLELIRLRHAAERQAGLRAY